MTKTTPTADATSSAKTTLTPKTTSTPKTTLTSKASLTPKAPLMLRKDAAHAVEPEDTAASVENYSQKKKQEPGRFWLQVDRQTKSSYDTFEAAQANGLLIKKQYSLLQVAVYDKQESTNTVLECPTREDASVSGPD